MNAIEKRAREMYAQHAEALGFPETAKVAREGMFDDNPSIRAIIAALTPPEGYVLVPVEPTEAMQQAAADYLDVPVKANGLWTAMLAARPEVP